MIESLEVNLTGGKHSFQVNGVEVASIDATGFVGPVTAADYGMFASRKYR